MDYSEYNNMILEGAYSFPFTVHLPDWIPQTHLCFNTPDQKKPHIINSFKIKYDIIAAVESTNTKVPGQLVKIKKKSGVLDHSSDEFMVYERRITVLTPD